MSILKVEEGEPESGFGEVDGGTHTDVRLDDVEGFASKASDVGGIVERRGLVGAKNVERAGEANGIVDGVVDGDAEGCDPGVGKQGGTLAGVCVPEGLAGTEGSVGTGVGSVVVKVRDESSVEEGGGAGGCRSSSARDPSMTGRVEG